MSKRYIDADALLSRLPDDLPYKASVKRVLMQAPTADVVEVRHGRWVYTAAYECFVCSNCRLSALNNYRGLSVNSEYCPHCGAKMDGERSTKDAT